MLNNQRAAQNDALTKQKYAEALKQQVLDNQYRQQAIDIQKKQQSRLDRKETLDNMIRSFTSDYNAYLPRMIEANKDDRTGFLRDVGNFISQYEEVPQDTLAKSQDMFDQTVGKVNTKGDRDPLLGQMYRSLGTDATFYSQAYNGGKMPESVDELNEMMQKANQDPTRSQKRTAWSNERIANTMKNLGLSAIDPSKNVYEDRFGNQVLMNSKGDTIDQKLDNPSTEEINKLAEYGNTFREIGQIRDAFNESFVGVFDGNWNNVKSMFADTPEFTKFKNMSNRLRTIIYGLSGKQINETEQQWLDSILAKIYNPDENFQANLDALEQWTEDRHNSFLIQLRNSRRYVGNKPLGDEEPPQPAEEPKRIRVKLN